MSATDELRRMLDERGVEYKRHYLDTSWYMGMKLYMATDDVDGTLTVDNLTPEQAIAATLGSDASAVRLAERLRSIAYEMRSVGASSMTPHELLACYANDVEKVADSLMSAATLGNSRAERTCRIEGRYGNKYCTCCGEMVGTWDSTSELYIDGNMVELWNYCPNCGARVVS